MVGAPNQSSCSCRFDCLMHDVVGNGPERIGQCSDDRRYAPIQVAPSAARSARWIA